MCQKLIQRRHLIFGDSILETLQGSFLREFRSRRVGECEDVLGKREKRVFGESWFRTGVLWLSTHDELRVQTRTRRRRRMIMMWLG